MTEPYLSEDFQEQMEECYFHPSRDTCFPDGLKEIAFRAMLILWEREEIVFLGRRFDQREIRKIILNEMTPADMDSAVELFEYIPDMRAPEQLAELIFAEAVLSRPIGEMLFAQECGRGAA